MLMQRAFCYCFKSVASQRFISQSAKNVESKISDTSKVSLSASASPSGSDGSSSVVGSRMVAPNSFEKWILVWMKKFPKGEVPDRIKEEFLYQTKSRARIKAANYMTVFVAVMCIVAAMNGRKARDEGDSLRQRNVDWHKKINEEHKAELKTKP